MKSELKDWAESACDKIDAGFFTGDTFQSREAVDRIEFYINRWQREIISIKDDLAMKESEIKSNNA
jgi:hypothetical protein